MIPEELLATARAEFEQVLQFVTGANNTQIADIEKGIFQRLLKLGCILLLMYVQKIVIKKAAFHTDKNGIKRDFHSMKKQSYFSIFGKIDINRPYYWKKSSGGICPADAELNLPEGGRSYLLQEWGTCLSVEQPYDKAAAFLNKFLGTQLWDSALEEAVRKGSVDVNEFYKDRSIQSDAGNKILVASVDCKGVQMRKSELQKKQEPPKFRHMRRLKEKIKNISEVTECENDKHEGKKKMSVVTAVYTINPHIRTAEEIIAKHKKTDNKKPTAPRPQQKIVYGTLEGKQMAFEHLKIEINKRDLCGKKLIALVDGELKLNEMLKEYLPEFEIIRDFIHVTEYVWDGVHIFYAEGSKEAEELASEYIKMLLKGEVNNVIAKIKKNGKTISRSKTKKRELDRVVNYLENGKDCMKYDKYLMHGYPIASGVIEGTSRNLVNDRLEHSGMHWSIKGANALLRMRSIEINRLTTDYWQYHQNKERERLYGHLGTWEVGLAA